MLDLFPWVRLMPSQFPLHWVKTSPPLLRLSHFQGEPYIVLKEQPLPHHGSVCKAHCIGVWFSGTNKAWWPSTVGELPQQFSWGAQFLCGAQGWFHINGQWQSQSKVVRLGNWTDNIILWVMSSPSTTTISPAARMTHSLCVLLIYFITKLCMCLHEMRCSSKYFGVRNTGKVHHIISA